MLSTHPDAFRRPSGLDRMEERPTSRSCVGCVVWEGKETDGVLVSFELPGGTSQIWNFGGYINFVSQSWLEI